MTTESPKTSHSARRSVIIGKQCNAGEEVRGKALMLPCYSFVIGSMKSLTPAVASESRVAKAKNTYRL